MKKALSIILATLMIVSFSAMTASAVAQEFLLYELRGCYFITSPYKWNDPELAEVVATIEEMTLSTKDEKRYYIPERFVDSQLSDSEPIYDEVIIDGVTNYRYSVLTYTPDGVDKEDFHRQMYKALMAFEHITLECKIEIVDPNNTYMNYDVNTFIITTKYQENVPELQSILSGLPEHSFYEYEYFENPDTENYPNVYCVNIKGELNTFFANYQYLKKFDGINIYFESSVEPTMVGEYYTGFYPAKGDIDGSAEVNAADASIVLRYDVALLEYPISLQTADVNRDGEVNAMDAALILQYDVGLISEF